MTRNKTKQNYHIAKGISKYVAWYREMMNYCFIITPDGNFYLKDGIRIPAKQFESSFPTVELQVNRVSKGKGLDTRVII